MQTLERMPASKSPAWTPSRCSPLRARTARSPASCSSAPITSRKGNPRKKILIPDSAHGTNPATAAICGYQVENLRSDSRGMVDVGAACERRSTTTSPR